MNLFKEKIPFTQIPNKLINDVDLSLKAKGLYCFMFSKPNNWNFTTKSMATQLNEGVKLVANSLKELKEKGWVLYKKQKNGKGKYILNVEPLGTVVVPKRQKSVMADCHNSILPKRECISNTDYSSKIDISTTTEKKSENLDLDNYKSKLKTKIETNILLLEVLAMQQKIKLKTIKSKIEEFVKHRISVNGIEVINPMMEKDLYLHFGNWIRSLKLSDIDLKDEFEIFMNLFNKYSKKDFVGTEKIKDLFTEAIKNGFTGKQMLSAIVNLYSSSENNKWHKNNNWEFATPEHLLKNENLNKYLNANY